MHKMEGFDHLVFLPALYHISYPFRKSVDRDPVQRLDVCRETTECLRSREHGKEIALSRPGTK